MGTDSVEAAGVCRPLRLVEVKTARWAQLIFSWYGIPLMMTQDFSRDGIYALAGKAVDNICMKAQNVLAL